MTHVLSGCILLALIGGRGLNKFRPRLHSVVMSLVIFSDIAFILYLVTGRKVLGKIEVDMPFLLVVHIILALVVVALYLQALWFGVRLLRNAGDTRARKKMRQIDRWVIPLRTATFVSSLILAYL